MRYSLLIKAPGMGQLGVEDLIHKNLGPVKTIHSIRTEMAGGVAQVELNLKGQQVTAMYRWFGQHTSNVADPTPQPAPSGALLLFTEVPTPTPEEH